MNILTLKMIRNLKMKVTFYGGIFNQPDATQYNLFNSVNCSTCSVLYFTHHQQLITLYAQYLALMRLVLLLIVNVAEIPLSQVHDS